MAFAQEDDAGEPSAQTQDDVGQSADRHYGEAVRLFGQGRYHEAIDEFDRAIELGGEPIFFCNRGVALIKLNEWESALSDLRTCRQTFDGEADELAQIDAQHRGLRAFVRGVRPRAVEVARDIAAGDISPRVVQVNEPQSPWNLELAGHLSLGSGAVLLTAALMLDYLSSDLREDFITESKGGPGTSEQRYRELRDDISTRRKVLAGLGISGAVLATTGVSILTYSWFFADDAEQEPTAGSMSVAPFEDGASLQLQFDF
jgi:tetratricopeptide (TPR) repeat protein